MKKWMKGLTIAGVVMIFAGTGISALAGVAGGIRSNYFGMRPFRRVMERVVYRNNSIIPFQEWDDDDYDYNYSYDVNDISSKGEMTMVGSYKGIKNLELKVGNAIVKVVENPELSDELVFYMKNKEYCSFSQDTEDGGTGISVVYRSSKSRYHAEGILEIPIGFKFDEADFVVGAGELYVSSVLAKSLKLDVAAGNLTVEAFEADELEVDVAAGEARARGLINSDLEADLEAGSIDLSLAGQQTDFQYRLNCAMGNIQVGDTEYSAFAMKENLNSGAGKKADLNCNMGEIKVTFY